MIERLEQIVGRTVSRETFDRLTLYTDLLTAENERQNLVSRGTIEGLWDRHILDSAQLARFQRRTDSSWADVGSGAGLPGIVLACLVKGPVTLIEPRRLRAVFLSQVIDKLGLNARVVAAKAERTSGNYDIICARAVTSVSKLLKISYHLSTRNSIWVLPKGKIGRTELVDARHTWQAEFHVEQSLTDSESVIITARDVRPK